MIEAKIKLRLLIILVVIATAASVFFLTINNNTEVKSASWYDSAWGNRKKITILNGEVDADLTDFPVYINMANLGADFFSSVKSDGSDIVITSSDGITKLERELVEFNKAGSTGELWFKAPSLANLTDTEFYIYYGNSAGAETNSTALWSGYTLVEHLEEDPSGTAPQVHDSKGSFNFNSVGSMTTGDLVSAKLGNGLDFDGTNDYLQSTTNLGISGGASRTLSLWFKLDGTVGKKMIGSGGNSNTAIFDVMTSNVNTFIGHFYGGGNDTTAGASSVSAGTWYHGTLTYNGSTVTVYLNGAQTNTKVIALSTTNSVFRIGNGGYSASSLMDGILDEVRVSNNVKTATWISTEYSNQNAPGSFYVIGSEESQSAGAWYNQNWSYRVKFTIFSSNVYENVTNFPVYVDLSDMEAAFFTSVKTDGSDIVITAGDGVTKLDRELVVLNTSAQTGELWFKAPTLSTTVDTDFYIYFGNPDGVEANTTAVWSNNYTMVQHLNENPAASAPQMQDSTASNIDGTSGGTMTLSDSITGQIGQALDFDGVDDFINLGNNQLQQANNFTASAWVKLDNANPTGIRQIFGTYGRRWGLGVESANLYFAGYDGSLLKAEVSTTTSWVYIVGVKSSTGNGLTLYLNGVSGDTNSTPTVAITYAAGNTYIGSDALDSTGRALDGQIDEVRFSSDKKTAGWIQTEYYNQSTPSTFYEIEEIEAIADWYGDNWAYRIKITVDPAYVFEDVINFPVYVDLNDLGVNFFNNVKSDGSDIVVTSADGITKLERELVTIDTGTDTGELWFKALSLSNTYDTDFYIYFGNSSATETNSTAVWSNGYVMVQHMEEDPTASAPQILDSTANSINGTTNGMVGGDLIDAKMGKGLVFDGTNNYIGFGAQAALNVVTNTVSFWINWRNTGAWVYNGNNASGDTRNGLALDVDRHITADQFLPSGGSSFTSNQIANQDWTYVSVEFNGTTDRVFFDGNLVHTEASETYTGAAPTNWLIGSRLNPVSASYYINSYLDEFRVSNTTRSSGWIQTEYYNQFSPNVFYIVDEIDTDRILKVAQDTETPNAAGPVIVCMQALQEITADSLLGIYFSSSYSVSGGGSFSDADFDAYCDSNGEEGGSQIPMSAVSIVSQSIDSIIFDTNTDTCSQWMCIDFSGGSKLFENPPGEGNYEWAVTMDIGGNATIEQTQTVLQFIGDLNEVGVSGYIPPLIALDIYENNSDTKTNSCALGVLSINEINTCSYDIGASVNAHSGVSLHMSSDGELDSGGAEIDACSSTGCTSKGSQGVTVGEEEYGFYISENGSGEFEVTEYYDEQHQPVPQAFTMIASSSSNGSGTVTGSAAQRLELTHAVSIDLATPSGSYSQVLTFRLFSN